MPEVYLINGFFEAGKTTFINELLAKDYFKIKGKTLILSCEEGDTEYDSDILKENRTEVEYIESEEDFNEENITALEKKHKPERVLVEFNGMWDRKNTKFPWYWENIAEVAIIDASTFKLYIDNMRSFIAEQIRNAGIVCLNRCDKVRDKLAGYARNIKAINRGAALLFKGEEGEIQLDPDENLPYDIEEDELDLDDTGFFTFCIDSLERYGTYNGKRINFKARVYKMKDGGDFEFVAGRYVMTCCEADMTLVGIICSYFKAYELENKEWVDISGIVKVSYDTETKKTLPICRVTSVKRIEEPENDIINLVG